MRTMLRGTVTNAFFLRDASSNVINLSVVQRWTQNVPEL